MPKGSKVEKAAKRRVVAAGAIAGKTTKAVAKKAGCSTRHVQRLAAEAETQDLIAEAMRPCRDQLRLMAKRAVNAVERAMKAQKKTKADHFTQLRAVERYGDLLELAAGDGKQDSLKSGKGRRLVTWEEFLIIGRGRTETA
jgi:hypothetical protein